VGERCLLDEILEPGSLSVCFQPVLEVCSLQPRAHYFEALIRGPRGTSAESPAILFEYARKKSKESAVDRACVEAILEAARNLPEEASEGSGAGRAKGSAKPPEMSRGATLGINVHASTLAMDPGFVGFLGSRLEALRLSPRRLVVEVVEHAPPWDVVGFRTALEALRGLGARVALDDVGLGHSNFMMIIECRPDYFKVDRYFVHGCHRDFHRRAVLASVAQLARPFGARVVAEGVEEPADLSALKRLGINLIQGHLFGAAHPASDREESVPSGPTRASARPSLRGPHSRR
jgi:EAL domain-containing protein (putative c-di-GMP-specific phosphodiesterase class I)